MDNETSIKLHTRDGEGFLCQLYNNDKKNITLSNKEKDMRKQPQLDMALIWGKSSNNFVKPISKDLFNNEY